MANEELKSVSEEQIFPRYPQKTYGLMEMMKGTTTIVGKGGEQDSVLSWPNLIILEFILMIGATAALLFWSLVQNAPLTEMANPDLTENPAKAPWYFLGLQEMLLHMSASLAGVLIPTLLIVALIALPYIDRNTRDVGIWFASRKGKTISAFSFVYAVIWIVILVLINSVFFPLRQYLTAAPIPVFDQEFWTQIVTLWIYPICVIGALIAAMMVIIRAIWRPNMREMVLGLFSAFVGVLVMMTVFGTMFRGRNMLLRSPLEVLTDGFGIFIGPGIAILLGIVLVVLISGSQKEEPVR